MLTFTGYHLEENLENDNSDFLCFIDGDESTLTELLVADCYVGLNKKKLLFTIHVDPDKKRLGDPYFKIYSTHNEMMRIKFLKPEYVYHKNTDGCADWFINQNVREILYDFLHQPYSGKSKDGEGLTNWQYAIVLFNLRFRDVKKDDTMRGNIKEGCIRFDQIIPKYGTELPDVDASKVKNTRKRRR